MFASKESRADGKEKRKRRADFEGSGEESLAAEVQQTSRPWPCTLGTWTEATRSGQQCPPETATDWFRTEGVRKNSEIVGWKPAQKSDTGCFLAGTPK